MAATPTACLTASDVNLERRQFKSNGQIMSLCHNKLKSGLMLHLSSTLKLGWTMYADTTAYKHNRKS
jgi:hypothetical protein